MDPLAPTCTFMIGRLADGLFSFGVGMLGIPWLYPTEVNSLPMRTKGAAVATATNWITNFAIVEITPIGIQNLGWQFWIVWTVFCAASMPIIYFLYPETGWSLCSHFRGNFSLTGLQQTELSRILMHIIGRTHRSLSLWTRRLLKSSDPGSTLKLKDSRPSAQLVHTTLLLLCRQRRVVLRTLMRRARRRATELDRCKGLNAQTQEIPNWRIYEAISSFPIYQVLVPSPACGLRA